MDRLQKRAGKKYTVVLLAGILCAMLLQAGCGEEREATESTVNGLDQEGADEPSEKRRALTAKELDYFNEYVNQKENNGFLLCQYSEPGGVNLDDVFYNGAGIEMQPLSAEEEKIYESLGYPIETDVFRLRGSQIEEFLRRKMGIGMEDVSGSLDWVYLEETDCYVTQHGDTNFCSFLCTEGWQMEGQEYVLCCRAESPYVKDCELRLKKEGEQYQFLSNLFILSDDDRTASRVIEEQSFMVKLNDFGMVRFVSLEPDLLKNPREDVVFELWEENEVVYTFPWMAGDNMRMVDTFCQIEAVSFKDYDKDGYTDVIVICTYKRDMGDSAGGRYQEARVYKGAEKSFHYMDELSLSLNISKYNKTIAQIMEQIEEEGKAPGANLDVYRQLKAFAETKEEWNYQSADYDPYLMGFAVYDLDGDGRLELMTYARAGTGLYSENHFYRVSNSGDGIEEIPQDYYDGVSELDIGSGVQAYLDETSGITYFLATDVVRNGYAESWWIDGAFYLEADCVHSVAYRTVHSVSKGRNELAQGSYYDPAGNEISEAEWVELGELFLENKTDIACSFGWQFLYPEELRQMSEEELLELLAESCCMAGL